MNSNRFIKLVKRRRIIQGMFWFGGTLLLTKGCASPTTSGAVGSSEPSSNASTPIAASSDTCVLYPEQIEGPYYIDLDLVRQDITEGRGGAPLKLFLRVNDAENCAPIPGVAVDIWHCDAAGNYAGYSTAATSPPGSGYGEAANGDGMYRTPSNNETFLRGTQLTDANGQVMFATIYPGWYTGRTAHIHVKVHLDTNTVLTSQMYFPEQITRTVYAQEPYNNRPDQNTTNEQDFLIGNNEAVLINLSEDENGYTGQLTIAVAR